MNQFMRCLFHVCESKQPRSCLRPRLLLVPRISFSLITCTTAGRKSMHARSTGATREESP